jgi:hypothetical protein
MREIGIAKVCESAACRVICGTSGLQFQFTVPEMALKVVDRAIQVHGAEGISQDQPLAYFYASLRTLRFADVSRSSGSALQTYEIDGRSSGLCGGADVEGS